jgi:hypothetical protein
MKTYKNFEEDFEKAKANMELLENLVSVGIPKKQAVYFNSISVDSKYSMGQRTYLYVGDKLVHCNDERKFYVGHNKFIETHGKIVVRFNKGEFKKYMAMCEEMYKALVIEANASKYISLVDDIKELIKPNINIKVSQFNRNTGLGCITISKQFV